MGQAQPQHQPQPSPAASISPSPAAYPLSGGEAGQAKLRSEDFRVTASLKPLNAGGRCRPCILTEKPKVKRVYPSTSDVHEAAEKCKRLRSATLAEASKGVASAANGLQQ